MSKKHSKTHEINCVSRDTAQIIDMNLLNRKKAYCKVGFKTGRHITEKDRPRKKNWLKEMDYRQ